jgi:hypothetical protein
VPDKLEYLNFSILTAVSNISSLLTLMQVVKASKEKSSCVHREGVQREYRYRSTHC